MAHYTWPQAQGGIDKSFDIPTLVYQSRQAGCIPARAAISGADNAPDDWITELREMALTKLDRLSETVTQSVKNIMGEKSLALPSLVLEAKRAQKEIEINLKD